MPDDLRTVVAKAIYYSNDTNAYGDVPLWEELEELSPREREVAFEQGDAALTAALSWLEAEADSKFPFRHCMAYDEASGVWISPTDWIRSHIPPRQEGDDGEG